MPIKEHEKNQLIGALTHMVFIPSYAEHATLCFADITLENANVWLEVGYAIAKGIPLVYRAKNGTELPFDMRNHHGNFYEEENNTLTFNFDLIAEIKARHKNHDGEK